MSQITGGRVAYKRVIQPAPYESTAAEVEFVFTVDAKEDPAEVAATILEIARTEVHTELGIKSKR